MMKLRKMIDASCPIIFTGSWEMENRNGWRWVRNLDINDDKSVDIVDDYQTAHGPTNVTVGHAWDATQMKPVASNRSCGLYVRDIDELIARHKRDLDNLEGLARWLSLGPDEDLED